MMIDRTRELTAALQIAADQLKADPLARGDAAWPNRVRRCEEHSIPSERFAAVSDLANAAVRLVWTARGVPF